MLEDMAMDHDGYDSARPELMMRAGDEEVLEGVEKYRAILMTTFLNDDVNQIPPLLTGPTLPQDMDIDLIIDDQGHTALHWAAALARIQVLELLIQKQADVRRVNYNGESALVRAVIVTNNYDRQSFPHLLHILHNAIPLVDRKNRTLLHHIAIAAGIRGRGPASHYYMECLFEWIARNGGDFSSLIDVQDKNGDTALTITARIGDRYLAKFLIDVGANRELENKVGLKAADFGVDGVPVSQPLQFALLFIFGAMVPDECTLMTENVSLFGMRVIVRSLRKAIRTTGIHSRHRSFSRGTQRSAGSEEGKRFDVR